MWTVLQLGATTWTHLDGDTLTLRSKSGLGTWTGWISLKALKLFRLPAVSPGRVTVAVL